MSFQDHLQNCSYCRNAQTQHKPTIRVKSASSYNRRKKLSELNSIISGTSYSTVLYPSVKAASSIDIAKSKKLKELANLIKDYVAA